MNIWYMRSIPRITVLAQDRKTLIASWAKLINLGAQHVVPAHQKSFPI